MLTSKLPDVGTSIFSVMTQLATEHGAINLAQGFPDFNPPTALTEALAHHAHGPQHQYAPMPGLPQLRERIAAKTARVYGVPAPDPVTDITITSGATEALYAVLAAVVQPGDEVLVLEPAYDLYGPAIRLQGGRPVYVPLTAPSFQPDWQRIAAAITPRTRLVMVNTPHNPSGAVFSDDDWQQLAAILAPTHALLLSDEVYEHMTFDGQPHRSALQYPQLRERAFVLSSFGKTYHATGWKVGYCVAPPALSAEVRRVHQFVTFSVSTLAQLAIADVIDEAAHYEELPAFMQAKRDLFGELLRGSRFELLPTAGSYFQLARYHRIAPGLDDAAFARRLTTETGVAVVPVSAFYHDHTDHGLIRFCFAKQDATLRAAAERLLQV
ncbi:aminotransferase class I/II-fold pyridoxal phosphate-dependent enzyme [Hymenobacter busanensis]|uniref:Aminotransferase class I/II-fold pyridoxal phosphate-dependent enzyme n=1 Tax=Hymenobacter busanensis TaxID=2607656 RepID=A0A7L4ZWI8_9BACT|nr:methionine aminotransferase [Hymenobacter busanensis]KAA9333448.1 aminotransferase class I/II-fold pyridoxal phosphate-dependent enzyme [Hymenobacter busanensis]QHJ07869.1 aminotransferase class I/II-fold pyridoxal phosphate-dependent enzyme [Hymenobacter busanensis]